MAPGAGKAIWQDAGEWAIRELGFELDELELNRVFEEFKALADKKKEVYDGDIAALIEQELQLDYIRVARSKGLRWKMLLLRGVIAILFGLIAVALIPGQLVLGRCRIRGGHLLRLLFASDDDG